MKEFYIDNWKKNDVLIKYFYSNQIYEILIGNTQKLYYLKKIKWRRNTFHLNCYAKVSPEK